MRPSPVTFRAVVVSNQNRARRRFGRAKRKQNAPEVWEGDKIDISEDEDLPKGPTGTSLPLPSCFDFPLASRDHRVPIQTDAAGAKRPGDPMDIESNKE